MEQPNVFMNWITTVYALMRNREDDLLKNYVDRAYSTGYHDGIKFTYDKGAWEGHPYPHSETLAQEHEMSTAAREEYFKAKDQTNQMAHFMLSLLLINKEGKI